MIRVLIVDDSAFMRKALTKMLAEEAGIEVIGTARDGMDGLAKASELKPDLITLDLEMPKLDGLSMLRKLMQTQPTPVLVVSAITQEGVNATLKALELGALDFIPKYQDGSTSLEKLSHDIVRKVRTVARKGRLLKIDRQLKGTPPPSAPSSLPSPAPVRRGGRIHRDIVAIGVSTGGPPAVQKVLAALPEDFPACILVAQHMPGTFTGAFANRLDNLCKIKVAEAKPGDKILPGRAYICPGGKHLRVDLQGGHPVMHVTEKPETALYKPSVNVLMESLGQSMGSRAIGVTMTGMGSDGLDGSKILKEKSGYLIAQSEASCVVYGMPKAIVDAGLVDEIVDLEQMADAIQDALYR